MPRLPRIILAVAAAAVAVAVAFIAAVSLLISPKDYAPALSRAVQAATGRTLTIRGELGLSFLPCCGINLAGASLGNPPGFPATPFLEVADARLTFRLWPLLTRREVQVGRVMVDGLRVALLEQADGRRNWEFGSGEANPAASSAGMSAGDFRVAALAIRNAALTYRSDRSGSEYSLGNLALRTSELAPGQSFDIAASGRLADAASGLALDVQLVSGGLVAADGTVVTLTRPKLTAAARGGSLPGRQLTATLGAGEVHYSRAQRTLRLQRVEGEVAVPGLRSPVADLEASFVVPEVRGSVATPFTLEAPVASATVSLKGEGIQGHAVEGRFDLGNLARGGDSSFRVARIDGHLDGSHVTGRLTIPAGDSAATEFDVRVDKLDVDHYRSPRSPAERKAGSGAAVELPRDTLRALRLDGKLEVGELTLAGARFGSVSATIHADRQSLRVDPLSASLYGGTLRGRLALDSAGGVPQLTLRQQLNGVKIGDLLRDAYQTDKLVGTLTATLEATGAGPTDEAIMRSLAGTASAHLSGGAWRGVDFWYEVRNARALLRREAGPPRPADPRTPITRLEFAGRIADGTWRSDSLAAEIPFVQLGGSGGLDLAGHRVDFTLHADVTQPPVFPDGTNLRDLAGLSIPLTVTGPMQAPRVRVDLANLAKSAFADRLKQKLAKKLGLDAPEPEVAPGEGQPPESPKDALRRKLRDLLRR